ncbi:2-C-methyl-D-erythritol 4-phosphate cytidylyltransferase [Quadrisphaera granulorum]|uniref:2-C-methyl-D-erythritol 4-phosphate cytidylyltransferase n=1 Tax=Quadrisphaera granulorum TaxID=317664 RepID=A0A316A3Z2_9ACTN|nr:bifunctional cytidylyltransferase/SDR family oxidoreductase [Quadrisphaera granulorum]PWJ52611.1 2-C-methyl-D-erythritol 4-phosphate cytidylyltransferase [Quadrisphaera granulorum]SZE97661.1 2-C-methyl-D-erythritol 4-phosphate cytidylyltransferase [Quadrisphaera granulorum]
MTNLTQGPLAGTDRRSLPVIGIILAGGTGSRAGSALPKQFVRVAGKPVLQHTVEIFERSDAIDMIVVVAHRDHLARATSIAQTAARAKPVLVVDGGTTRFDSTSNALDHLKARGVLDAKVLIHDAVRPLLDERIIKDCVAALDMLDAVDVVVPTSDTIVEVDAAGDITDIPLRERLRRGQTPQGFILHTIQRAYEAAKASPLPAPVTDDCGVLRAFAPATTIGTVLGAETNIKVTHPQDFMLLDQLFRSRSTGDTEVKHDALRGQVVLVLGGTRGIGAALAAALRKAGALAEVPSRTDGLDVRDEASVQRVVDGVERKHGRVDSVVLCAGTLSHGSVTRAEPRQLQEMIETNFWGPVAVARAVHGALQRSGGQLVLFGSSSYTRGRDGYAVYSATKAAVVNLTQALAEEWYDDGVRVNCVSPARTRTDMRSGFSEPESNTGLLEAEEVAHATIAVLTSSTTGSVIDVKYVEAVREKALASL